MKKKLLVILGLVIAVVSLFVLSKEVQAAFAGEGLTISPPINEPKIKPGQTMEFTIKVNNPTAGTVEVYPQAMDFKAAGESGEPAFYTSEDGSDKFSLVRWISFSTSKIALTPSQIVDFKYSITIPADAEPGGHYGAVFFVSDPPTDTNPGSKVTIGSMVGSLVLLTVPGETIEKGVVDEFYANSSLYMSGNTADFTTRISNIGNVHFKPRGNIVIKSVLGGRQETSLVFNEQNGNVLPDSTRKFTNQWKHPWYQFGIYRAELATVYGVSEKPLTSTFVFWIIPWWLIVAIVVLLLILLLVIWLARRNRTPRPPKPPRFSKRNKEPERPQPVILR